MGSDVVEVVEGLPSPRTIKVHSRMCLELRKVVIKVLKVFPEIEAARPRCSSGIEALCLLNNGIVKAKSLLQSCKESSVLYLALTGDAILSRCKKSRNLLEQSLCQLQNMVPILLASKISGIISDLRNAVFCLNPHEEEAGKVLRELLHRYGSTIDSTEESALSAIQFASLRLHLNSPKALLIEKRSIRKMLDNCERNKRKILFFFLDLLKKYGEVITRDQTDLDLAENGDTFSLTSPYNLSSEMELRLSYGSGESGINMLSRPVPPAEFICPLSSRLMHDPVVIASGQTYERTWIQRWFDEGHDTCPKTNKKLGNLSFTSNTGMKDLILKWCATHSVSVPDPKIQEALERSWETSVNSIASLTSSMNDLNLPLDFSNISLGSTHVSDISTEVRISDDVGATHEIDVDFLTNFSSLTWDSQCGAIEDLKSLLRRNDQSLSKIPLGEFVQLLARFLRDALDHQDPEAQMAGCLLFYEFVQKHRDHTSYMNKGTYVLLASFLDTELAKQALSILGVLSFNENCASEIAESGALTGMLNILDSQVEELLEPALIILSNLSSINDIKSFTIPSDLILKIIPFFEDSTLARHCIIILKNLSEHEDARVSIAETDGCINSIARVLESESRTDQEHAVSILLALCSQRVLYCQLVMDEGIIPGLVSITLNGNEKAKVKATELLRILRDEFSTPAESSGSEIVVESAKEYKDKNPPKNPGLFGKLFAAKKKK